MQYFKEQKHQIKEKKKRHKVVSSVFGWGYGENQGCPEGGISPGTPWSEAPKELECPLCSVDKERFEET